MSGGDQWLLDLGNSRAKVARFEAGRPVDAFALDWQRADFAAALQARLAAFPQPAKVWIASVAPALRAQAVQAALASLRPACVEWLRSPRHAGGVTNSYAKPERLGIDRFLAMLAAHAEGGAACVVGCGTALTLDALTAAGRHTEGMITLSPGGALQALKGATAIADTNPDAFTLAASDDTARALHAGCWAAAGALVEWFVTRSQAHGPLQHVWLHGGWASPLADWLRADGMPVEMLEDAVLRGLAVWVAGDTVESSADHS